MVLFFPEHPWFAAFEGNQVVECFAEEAPGCEAQHHLAALQFAVCSLSSCPLPAKWITSHSRYSWLASLCENQSGIISQLLQDTWFCTTKIAPPLWSLLHWPPLKLSPFFGFIWAYWFKSVWKIINGVFILSIWNWPWSGSGLCTNPSKPVWPFRFLVSIW